MIRKRDVCKAFSLFTVSAMTVSFFNYADVGASDDISLQSPISALEVVAVYEPEEIPVVYVPEDNKTNVRKDTFNIENNTLTVTESVDSEVELLDESTFTYDGNNCWISVNRANLRTEPDVDSEILSELDYGTCVLRISYGTLYSKIRLEDGTEGFILTSHLDTEEIEAEEEEEEEITATPTPTAAPTAAPASNAEETTVAQTTAASYSESSYEATLYASCDMYVRTGPGTSYSFITLLSPGDEINVIAQTDNGWYKTSSGYYVKADLCVSEPPAAPEPQTTSQESSSSSEQNSVSTSGPSGDGSGFADYCQGFVGIPYVYGGASTSGFDCSGFVSYVYANYYGVSLPHDAAGIAECGTAVSMDNLQCGDVICHDYNNDGYIEHVSIYIGNGTYIHASDSRHGVITTTYAGGIATVRRFV